jgi:hypothetical protein
MEVFHYLCEGLTNREIGEHLGLSRHTIKNYFFRMADKLGVSSRQEMIGRFATEGSRQVVVGESADVEVFEDGKLVAWISAKHLRTANGAVAKPPVSAQFLLLLLPKKYRENLVGDIDEEFSTVVLPRHGPRKARLWYWCQVIASIMPFVWAQIKRVAGLVLLWKAVK